MGRRPAIEDDADELLELDEEVVADDTDEAEGDDAGDSEVDPDASVEIDEDSVEVNVEDLIARIEADGCGGTLSARRKLEQYLEERRTFQDIMDFEDYDLDD